MPRSHDVSYIAYSQRGGEKVTYKSWEAATAAAVSGSMAAQTAFVIDVVVHTEQGAQRFGGDAGVRRFRDIADPSRVFERLEIRADSIGVPPLN